MECIEYVESHVMLEGVRAYRDGDVPPDNLPVVFLRFPIEDIRWACNNQPLSWPEISDAIDDRKEDIVRWAAQVAGGLKPDEFYCVSLVFQFEPHEGRILCGEIGFRRRFPAFSTVT